MINFDARTLVTYLSGGLLLAATFWAVRFTPESPADFTFVNNTEVKSLDPALVTGHPEGRVLQGLFEGIVSLDPKTLAAEPGIADRWEISDDQLTYTFHFRPNAKWSDGSTVTAHDVQWSLRRFLDPLTFGQYSYQAWYIKNAKRYSTGKINPGEPVEIELNELPADARPFARGKLLRGKLNRIDDQKRYFVEVDGLERAYSTGGSAEAIDCRQVLLDFGEVGVKALDAATLEIKLESPTPYFLSLLGFFPLFPVQPKCLETYGAPNWMKPENIVSNGPFRLHSRRIRDRLRMVRADTYWDREHVTCESIDVLAVESVVTALNLYLTGRVDWSPAVPTPIVPELLAQKRDDFHPAPELTIYFYRLNVTKPPLDKKQVRQALAMALNKQEIIDTVTRAGEIAARSFVPPGLPGYQSPQGPAYNPTEAQRLLADAGYPNGDTLPKIPILYNTDDAHQAIAELIQDQWKRTLGIQVEPQNQEWVSYLASQRLLDYSVCRAGWTGDYLDPNTFLDLFVSEGANNETGWSNKEYDRLIAEAATEIDGAKRMKLFEQAEAILLDEVPVIPIYFRVSKNLVRPYVTGFYSNLLDMHPLKTIAVDKQAKQKLFSSGGKP